MNINNCTDINSSKEEIDITFLIENELEIVIILISCSFLLGIITNLLCCFCCCCTRQNTHKMEEFRLDLDDMHEIDEETYEPNQAQAPPPEHVSQRLDPKMRIASEDKFPSPERSRAVSGNVSAVSAFNRQSGLNWISRSTGFFSSRTGFQFQTLPEVKRQSKVPKHKSKKRGNKP